MRGRLQQITISTVTQKDDIFWNSDELVLCNLAHPTYANA